VTEIAEREIQQSPVPPAPRGRDERSGRLGVIVVMIAALAACGLSGGWASDWKDHNAGPHSALAERGALSGMNSYSLALMLGGLRGPLVMVLWSKVENQKIDRDLEDVDTMIEWIRLLQPEFDTVHIFQIWNKAYNISALMASTASKYTTILDAIDYARRVDSDRPGDLNILDQIARVYGEKLGGPSVGERVFYRRQFREDTMTDANRAKAYPEDNATYRRMGLKFFGSKNGPILDDINNIDPRLLTPRIARRAQVPEDVEWNDGSELQYLKAYQPFPYGVSALAMGYNYAKRAQVTMTTTGQKPLQLSDTVLDSYPGLLLKQWAEQEQDRAVSFEARAFGQEAHQKSFPAAAADSPPDAKPVSSALQAGAIYSYGLSARVCGDALKEYQRHLANTQYVNPSMSYASHLAELKALQALATGDHAYAASFESGANRLQLLNEAAVAYRQALSAYERIVLTFHVEAAIIPKVFPNQRVELDKLSDTTMDQLYVRLLAEVQNLPLPAREYEDDREEYARYINRSAVRLQQLAGYGQRSILETR
jgi:hypothetical protein